MNQSALDSARPSNKAASSRCSRKRPVSLRQPHWEGPVATLTNAQHPPTSWCWLRQVHYLVLINLLGAGESAHVLFARDRAGQVGLCVAGLSDARPRGVHILDVAQCTPDVYACLHASTHASLHSSKCEHVLNSTVLNHTLPRAVPPPTPAQQHKSAVVQEQ
eukprot:GHRQ01034522.1.p1 GENE.GHRQ01034522.1~~GHRQ01034522.1.p1  ORF type:complete len:162 (+),score=5.79 GHRQ01034522.1:27-512(+)